MVIRIKAEASSQVTDLSMNGLIDPSDHRIYRVY